MQIFLLHNFLSHATKTATNIFSKQEKGYSLKLSSRQGMRKVKSKVSFSFTPSPQQFYPFFRRHLDL